ncbi:MAG TPA: LPS assembly lipoprotein LptE [Noviherbaspirillum sp.]|uniref:LPS-assembly lipoprotein LptE n=1 Tax=Noviherbaspirillum sp. TaxID=1926288 RepID=UPI002B49D907|nr:LPS assembly lipoprotein LptE [Noviherbaspirillum sp.]HJV84014.1 LPS assembly lipoprotein LptE [Noviherbaspirillum sp.]
MKRRAVLALTSVLALSACGFQLRGANGEANLPFKTIYIGVPETSPLGVELRRNIRASGETTIVPDPKAAEAILEVLSETRNTTVLLNTQGRPREHTLYYKVRFRVTDPKGVELLPPTEITLKRDLSFNEAQAIAKEKEEEMLYRDMQSDLVQQILRRMAVLKRA